MGGSEAVAVEISVSREPREDSWPTAGSELDWGSRMANDRIIVAFAVPVHADDRPEAGGEYHVIRRPCGRNDDGVRFPSFSTNPLQGFSVFLTLGAETQVNQPRVRRESPFQGGYQRCHRRAELPLEEHVVMD